MFTTKNLDDALDEVRGFHESTIFCPEKSLIAYRLSKMSRNYRGAVVERMIRDYYVDHGKDVDYYGGSNSFDMMVDGKKVEVKSALATKSNTGYAYRFAYEDIEDDFIEHYSFIVCFCCDVSVPKRT